MIVRPTDPERDAGDCVALLRATSPGVVTNRAAWLHRVRSIPERARPCGLVAEEDGRVVGESYGFLGLFGDGATGTCNVAVAEGHRRRGAGKALFAPIAEHLTAAGATNLLARFVESDAGCAFATALGFHEVRAETESSLDLRRFTGGPPAGLDLRTVAETDPRDAHLVADPESGRSMNWFTGTRRAFRGHGSAARSSSRRSPGRARARHRRDGDRQRRDERADAGDQRAPRVPRRPPPRRVAQNGNGFFASAASTCDVTHTGVVTYRSE